MTRDPGEIHGRIKRTAGLIDRGRPVPQRQESLTDQLTDLHVVAAKFGLYDAADWLWKHGIEPSENRRV